MSIPSTFDTAPLAPIKAKLGRAGAWCGHLMSMSMKDEPAFAQKIEAMGYGSLWTGEVMGGKDIFSQAAMILTATSKIIFGTGIANLWARHPSTMRGASATIYNDFDHRLINGIGVSNPLIVTGSGQAYGKPLEKMRNYLGDMDGLVESTQGIDLPSISRSSGAAGTVTRILAALGPKMLELSRDRADGAHPYLVPPEHIAASREILGPVPLLIPEQGFLLCTDPAEARGKAREHMKFYMGMPAFQAMFRGFGYTDEDLADGGCDRMVDSLVVWGDEKDVAKRVDELISFGADHVTLQPLAATAQDALDQLERVAQTVL